MFGKLKEKLKSFLGKGKAEEKIEETPKEKPKKEPKPAPEPKKPETTQELKTQIKESTHPQKPKSQKTQKEKPDTLLKEPNEGQVGGTKPEPPEKEPQKPTPKPSEKPITEKPQTITPKESQKPEPLVALEKKPSFLKKLFKKKEEPQISAPQIQESPISKEKEESFLHKFTKKLSTSTLTQSHVDQIIEPLELILLENNVALEVVDIIRADLTKDLVNTEVKKGQIENKITTSLKDSISNVLQEPPDLINSIKESKKPYVIIFFGINGSGKTTSIAKLAHKLKQNNISCVLAAADTFRAAAIQQLETHANNLKIPIIKHDYGADPTAVAFDAKAYAQKNKIDCVLIDTAGRMYTKENLIKQMEKIIRVIQPNLKIFVGESITGNDATQQAKTFNEAVGIDGIILSKADVDEKGGTALSVSKVTNKPIYFLGVGQNYEDLQDFKKKTILENLGLD